MTDSIKKDVKDYYGEVLQTKDDLKTSASCPIDSVPKHLQALLKNIHPDIQNKFYGCGSPIPDAIEGKTIVDLGCGTGRDAYMLSQLVGPSGKVIGIDMTDKQLDVAKNHLDEHMKTFGYKTPNIEFHKAYIEDLSTIVKDNSVDVVISNCVINLSPDKEAVFKEIFRVLKPGGELLFSDVFSDRRIPKPLTTDPVLLGECLGGALYTQDFRRLLSALHVDDFRILAQGVIDLKDPEVIQKAGMIGFESLTVRTFKLPLEDAPENYAQTATYKGTIPHHSCAYTFDQNFHFPKGNPVAICSNTAKMIQDSRFKNHFEIRGDQSLHYGPFSSTEATTKSACC